MLPGSGQARVDQTKIVDYLLSPTHPDGRSKAEFFTRFGFKATEWQVLAEALRAVGAGNPVVAVSRAVSEWGTLHCRWPAAHPGWTRSESAYSMDRGARRGCPATCNRAPIVGFENAFV